MNQDHNSSRESTSAFFQRARFEAMRYGDDAWVFLRELVQNSRDAGASSILFEVNVEGDMERIACVDDGSGMTGDDVDHYLFKLYASSKAPEDDMVGLYGVGFWSVLNFDPACIQIETRDATGACCGYRIDCTNQSIAAFHTNLDRRGFRVVLERPKRSANTNSLVDILVHSLSRFVGPLRSRPGGRPMHIYVNNQCLDLGFPTPEILATGIRAQDREGLVGFGSQPWVRIYKCGILVREVTDLHEVFPSRGQKFTPASAGLHPQIAINDDHLRVLMDRKSIYEDEVLETLLAQAESKLAEIQNRILKGLLQPDFKNTGLRVLDWFGKHVKKGLTAVGLIAITFAAAAWWNATAQNGEGPKDPGRHQGAHPQVQSIQETPQVGRKLPLDAVFDGWREPRIDGPPPVTTSWDLEIEGPPDMVLVMGHLSRYQPKHGLVPDTSITPRDPVWASNSGPRVIVNMGLSGGAHPVLLPLPPGYALVRDSVRLDGVHAGKVSLTRSGDPVLVGPFVAGSRLTYEAMESGRDVTLVSEQFMEAPNNLPPEVEAELEAVRAMPTHEERVVAVANLVNRRIVYTQDRASMLAFAQLDSDWILKVLQLGRGDCDVMNGLNVLLLRAVGVPARMAVGLIRSGGRFQSSLHAWTNYHDGTHWRTQDVSSRSATEDRVRPAAADRFSGAAVSARPDSPNADWGLRLAAIVFGLALAVIVLWVYWRKRSKRPFTFSQLDAPSIYRAILSQGRLQNDQLKRAFAYVPIFRTTRGEKLSLCQLTRTARRESVFVGLADHPTLRMLDAKSTIIDAECPYAAAMFEIIPRLTTAHELQPAFEDCTLPPCLQALQDVVDRVVGPVSFRVQANDHPISSLTLRDKALGHRHVIIIGRHAAWFLRAERLYARSAVRGLSRMTLEVLTRCPLLCLRREDILRGVACWTPDVGAQAS